MVKQRGRKVGLSHYINPRPESIASRQRVEVFIFTRKVSYSFQSDSDEEFMSAVSSRRPQRTTSSSRTMAPKKRRRWDDVSLLLTI